VHGKGRRIMPLGLPDHITDTFISHMVYDVRACSGAHSLWKGNLGSPLEEFYRTSIYE